MDRPHRILELHPDDPRGAEGRGRRRCHAGATHGDRRELGEEEDDADQEREHEAEGQERIDPRPAARRGRDDRAEHPSDRIVHRLRQRERERAGGRVAALGLTREALRHDGVRGLGQSVVDGADVGGAPLEAIAQQILVLGAGERRLAGEQLVRDQGQAIHVGARRHCLSLDALGRDVARRPHELALLAVSSGARDAEVRQLRVAGVVHDDVRGLHVEVHEPGPMGRVERPGELADECRDLRRGQCAALGDDVTERPAAHVLHHDERVGAVLALVEDRDDVWMVHRGGAPGLGRESLAERGVGLRSEDLHRDVAVETLVARAPDLRRSTAVDVLGQAVAIGQHTPLEIGHVASHRKFRAADQARATSAARASS